MSQRRLGFVTASVAVAGFHSGRSFSKAEEEHRVHLCNNWWHRGLQSWKKACEVSVVPLHQAFIHHTDIMHLCVHPCLAKLWIMKACLFFFQYCLRLVFSEVVHVLAEVLQLWWLMKPCTYTLIFCAVPFDLSLHSQNLKKDFFFSVPPFFSLWGITSIKITGLRDQLLLGVLSFLLAASFFYSLSRVSMFQQVLGSLLRGTGHVSHQQ